MKKEKIRIGLLSAITIDHENQELILKGNLISDLPSGYRSVQGVKKHKVPFYSIKTVYWDIEKGLVSRHNTYWSCYFVFLLSSGQEIKCHARVFSDNHQLSAYVNTALAPRTGMYKEVVTKSTAIIERLKQLLKCK